MFKTSLHIEKRKPVNIAHLDICSSAFPVDLNNFRFVQLTDFHYGPWTKDSYIEAIIDLALSLKPEFSVLTGDYIQVSPTGLRHYYKNELTLKRAPTVSYHRAGKDLISRFAQLLQPLSQCGPVYGVIGNHDYLEGKATIMRLLSKQVQWLINRTCLHRSKNFSLLLAGIDDWKRGHPDLEQCQINTPQSDNNPVIKILLSHSPDISLSKDKALLSEYDLILCGHTHGGQICLPFNFPLITCTKQRTHVRGLSYLDNIPLFVSTGLGWGGLKLRLFCPPEITLITIKTR
ncbi:MAG: metallophosphoesterase [Deltaproteobacteria bacterium]|nr:metallophosphoesterase [Deltaproteobacteria bacterium]